MLEKIEKILQRIDWTLFIEELTSQEKEDFTVLRSGLKSVSNSLEFISGKTQLELTFPQSYVCEKVLNFLNKYGLKIDGSGFDGDACIWLEEDDDSNDYDYDVDDWSYDYDDFWYSDEDDLYDEDILD